MKNKPIHMICPNTLGGKTVLGYMSKKFIALLLAISKKMWKQENCT